MNTLHELTLKQIRTEMDDAQVKQSIIAMMMNMQDSAISKLERKPIAALPLGKLIAYLEALEANVELSVTLKSGDVVIIKQ